MLPRVGSSWRQATKQQLHVIASKHAQDGPKRLIQTFS